MAAAENKMLRALDAGISAAMAKRDELERLRRQHAETAVQLEAEIDGLRSEMYPAMMQAAKRSALQEQCDLFRVELAEAQRKAERKQRRAEALRRAEESARADAKPRVEEQREAAEHLDADEKPLAGEGQRMVADALTAEERPPWRRWAGTRPSTES